MDILNGLSYATLNLLVVVSWITISIIALSLMWLTIIKFKRVGTKIVLVPAILFLASQAVPNFRVENVEDKFEEVKQFSKTDKQIKLSSTIAKAEEVHFAIINNMTYNFVSVDGFIKTQTCKDYNILLVQERKGVVLFGSTFYAKPQKPQIDIKCK